MRREQFLGGLIVSSQLLLACGNTEQFRAEADKTKPPVPIESDYWSGHSSAQRMLINDTTEYQRLSQIINANKLKAVKLVDGKGKEEKIVYQQPKLPDVDFEKNTVLAYLSEPKNSVCCEIRITHYYIDRDNIHIFVEQAAENQAGKFPAMTQPYAIVAVPKTTKSPVWYLNGIEVK